MAIADSLAMGDAAARMAQNGVKSIVCLGVDFMAESVRATLDANGHHSVPVSLCRLLIDYFVDRHSGASIQVLV